MSESTELAALGEFFVYAGEDGKSRAQVRLVDGTIWVTQRQLADVYDKDVRTISEHIRNILDEGELAPRQRSGSSGRFEMSVRARVFARSFAWWTTTRCRWSWPSATSCALAVRQVSPVRRQGRRCRRATSSRRWRHRRPRRAAR